jgi:hypothetical protein
VNTGGGGGGSGTGGSGNRTGGNGGSGLIVVAYSTIYPTIRTFSTGYVVSYSAVSRPGFHVYTFTSGTGTVIF